ncbi:hypothetical protein [Planctomycetes bacterium Spa11]|uniref:Uncharacterized protein n=2 Tax=Botrimarina mediterranea TaxID=2528022 RepID=A0A518KBD2_9BACT|nr:hypothetical protein Spa11_33160 [Botrimarina mediterranea]QDV79751.1 hypothetical protein K2D_33670 [Planctomycetes bacterium K2D]
MRLKGIPLDVIASLAAPRRRRLPQGPVHVFIAIADHYEPMVGGAPLSQQMERVERWVRQYPESLGDFRDCWGRPPRHTFFYPAEVYEPEPVERLAHLCRVGYGEVEIHLHHDNDTASNLKETLLRFADTLRSEHGLLRDGPDGRPTYGFVHGNWALDNSRPDGRWCGVDNELKVLVETGCYGDFTLPSAPNPTQTRMVNSIYYARGVDGCRKSHDRGVRSRVGVIPAPEDLLLVQGPLALDWSRRKFGLAPSLENGEIHGGFPPSCRRLALWLNASVTVEGRENWRFIKLHTHGAKESNADVLLGGPTCDFHQTLRRLHLADADFNYYYVTTWEMTQLIHAAECGVEQPQLELLS